MKLKVIAVLLAFIPSLLIASPAQAQSPSSTYLHVNWAQAACGDDTYAAAQATFAASGLPTSGMFTWGPNPGDPYNILDYYRYSNTRVQIRKYWYTSLGNYRMLVVCDVRGTDRTRYVYSYGFGYPHAT